jgi:uroporphyrinogen-III synthase
MSVSKALVWTRSLETWEQDQDILAPELPKNVDLIHWPSQQISAPSAETLSSDALQRNHEQIFVTSQNALRFLQQKDLDRLQNHTFHTFGAQTAKALRQAGMTQVICHLEAKDGEQFAKVLGTKVDPNIPLVWWRGADVAFELGDSLQAAGFQLRELTTYIQKWGPFLADGRTKLRAQDIESHLFPYQNRIVFAFASPQAAKTFAPLLKAASLGKSALNAVAIGPSTAKALDPALWQGIKQSPEATIPSLLKTAIELLTAKKKNTDGE